VVVATYRGVCSGLQFTIYIRKSCFGLRSYPGGVIGLTMRSSTRIRAKVGVEEV
jgi:hypothetical protein